MKVYIFSDDTYFYLGCKGILTINGYETKRINQEKLSKNKGIEKGDLILIAVSNHLIAQESLINFSYIGARPILFVNISKLKTRHLSPNWINSLCSKKTSPNSLIHILENTKENKIIDKWKLTKRECEVIQELLKGSSIGNISNLFKISTKTVHSHKQNALKKIGLLHPAGIPYVGYQDFIFTVKH
ncbi:TPA: helix-turn-helix transcriptional regulator [Serratia marcescens]|nr:helix-turn-helix transcriptional regulator [Serratia marcescens]